MSSLLLLCFLFPLILSLLLLLYHFCHLPIFTLILALWINITKFHDHTNVWGLKKDLNYLSVTVNKHDVFCFSENLVSDCRNVSKLSIPGFNKPILLKRNDIPSAQSLSIYLRSELIGLRYRKRECKCHEVLPVKMF